MILAYYSSLCISSISIFFTSSYHWIFYISTHAILAFWILVEYLTMNDGSHKHGSKVRVNLFKAYQRTCTFIKVKVVQRSSINEIVTKQEIWSQLSVSGTTWQTLSQPEWCDVLLLLFYFVLKIWSNESVFWAEHWVPCFPLTFQ